MAKLKVKRLVVGALKTNCYLFFDSETHEAVIIDPGDDAAYITQTLQELNLRPTKIVATHGHFDHILAAAELELVYKIPFFISAKDNFLVKRMRQSAEHFLGLKSVIMPKQVSSVKEKVVLGKNDTRVLKIPGHTPGSIALYCEEEKILFAGDLIFADGTIGRYDFKYANKEKLLASVNLLKNLPVDVRVFPGHGEAFRLGHFLKHFES